MCFWVKHWDEWASQVALVVKNLPAMQETWVDPWVRKISWRRKWQLTLVFSLSITNSWSLLKLMFIESVMPSNHLILCHSLLLLPSIFPSIRVFSNELPLLIRRPNYWSFSFSISPSNEYSGLISFWIDWLDLLEVQGTH